MAINHDRFSVNLRYLLWRGGYSHESWVSTTAKWLGCPAWRALGLLEDERPSQTDVDILSEQLGIGPEELRFTLLIDELGDDLFHENLRCLISGAEHGDKKEIARQLGIHATSLSRWIAGTHRPDKRSRELLAQYFGLTSETELSQSPLFLSLVPIGEGHRKKWLLAAIDALDQKQLNELFPALRKLLT